jgi:ketosteroid isomerase-like protein
MAAGRGVSRPDGERLARLYFALAREGDVPKLLDLLDPDVQITLKTRGGRVLRGREEVASYLDELAETRLVYETTEERYHVVDDDRVIVEGRVRWMDEERVLRDDPVTWAIEFRNGLLLRSTPARSVGEAQAILATGAAGAPSQLHSQLHTQPHGQQRPQRTDEREG